MPREDGYQPFVEGCLRGSVRNLPYFSTGEWATGNPACPCSRTLYINAPNLGRDPCRKEQCQLRIGWVMIRAEMERTGGGVQPLQQGELKGGMRESSFRFSDPEATSPKGGRVREGYNGHSKSDWGGNDS